MARGRFIVLEGGEGAGKSTVARFLEGTLLEGTVLFTREPGGTPLAERIRSVMISEEAKSALAETQFSLAWAARFDHAQKVIEPALQKGIHVISERFDSATYAYQIRGQEAPQLKPLFFEFRKFLGAVPDIYILLDVDPAEGLRRATGSGKHIDHFEKRELAFHTRVHKGLKEFLKTVPSVAVDANRNLKEVERDVLQRVIDCIS